MLFNSYAFVFIFLPVFVAGYYGITYLFNEKNLFNMDKRLVDDGDWHEWLQ